MKAVSTRYHAYFKASGVEYGSCRVLPWEGSKWRIASIVRAIWWSLPARVPLWCMDWVRCIDCCVFRVRCMDCCILRVRHMKHMVISYGTVVGLYQALQIDKKQRSMMLNAVGWGDRSQHLSEADLSQIVHHRRPAWVYALWSLVLSDRMGGGIEPTTNE